VPSSDKMFVLSKAMRILGYLEVLKVKFAFFFTKNEDKLGCYGWRLKQQIFYFCKNYVICGLFASLLASALHGLSTCQIIQRSLLICSKLPLIDSSGTQNIPMETACN
jgi:hypothetical protein